MAKSFYRYLICIIIGILLYLVLGNKNGFSIGGELNEITDPEIDTLEGEDIDAKKKLTLKNRDFKEKGLDGPAGWNPRTGGRSDKFYANLVGLDFSGSDFSRTPEFDTYLDYLDFSGAYLRNTNFGDTTTSGLKFSFEFELTILNRNK